MSPLTVIRHATLAPMTDLSDWALIPDGALVVAYESAGAVWLARARTLTEGLVRIDADPDALAARNLTLDDLRRAVISANSSAPVGGLRGIDKNRTLKASGGMSKAEDFQSIVIAWRNGGAIRLKDVAQVYDSVDNDQVAAWYNDSKPSRFAPEGAQEPFIDWVKAATSKPVVGVGRFTALSARCGRNESGQAVTRRARAAST